MPQHHRAARRADLGREHPRAGQHLLVHATVACSSRHRSAQGPPHYADPQGLRAIAIEPARVVRAASLTTLGVYWSRPSANWPIPVPAASAGRSPATRPPAARGFRCSSAVAAGAASHAGRRRPVGAAGHVVTAPRLRGMGSARLACGRSAARRCRVWHARAAGSGTPRPAPAAADGAADAPRPAAG
jgi:hypothetical protein